MDTNKLLDRTMEVCGVHSDYALSKLLGVSKQAVSKWRLGQAFPDEITCEKIADHTGIALSSVLGVVGEQRAISKEAKAVWRRLASAAAVLLLVGMSTAGSSSVLSAERDHVALIDAEQSKGYALCEVVWRVVQAICAKVRGLMTPERSHACIA